MKATLAAAALIATVATVYGGAVVALFAQMNANILMLVR
jgi:hypothetical protein